MDRDEYTDYVIDPDPPQYLDFTVPKKQLKTPPPFDAWGALDSPAAPENELFGDANGQPANFTDFSPRERTGDPDAKLDPEKVRRLYILYDESNGFYRGYDATDRGQILVYPPGRERSGAIFPGSYQSRDKTAKRGLWRKFRPTLEQDARRRLQSRRYF